MLESLSRKREAIFELARREKERKPRREGSSAIAKNLEKEKKVIYQPGGGGESGRRRN